MRTPTLQQQAILDSKARVRVVRAAPGSGKTWLVAELIKQELGKWDAKGCGIAALSFTRVGGDEIRRSIGHDLDHPHFVGTIDAFLFRYIIRPFLRLCHPEFAEPHLIPGDWGAEHWRNCGPNQSTTVCKGGINLFRCVFMDDGQGRTVIAHRSYPGQPLLPLAGSDLKDVMRGKMRLWQGAGSFTHSDATLWASKILEHEAHGARVRAEVVRRFPLLIVDELQDTGFFLSKSIRLLLAEPAVRSVLVGDPDQAIFEFTGARPVLFDDFEAMEGAVSLPLTSSRRCPRSVAEAAKHIKDSGGEIVPAEERQGKAILVRYNDMRADVQRLVNTVTQRQATANIKVIARGKRTIEELIGRSSKAVPKLHCPALDHIHRAVANFRRGRQVAAIAAARAAVDVAAFGHETSSDEKLRNAQIDPSAWRLVAVRCLLRVNALPVTGTVFDWQEAAGKILDAELDGFGLDPNLGFHRVKLKPHKRGDHGKPVTDYLPETDRAHSTLNAVPVQTVHSVKGETHDVTIFVAPERLANHCPSSVWWSNREEKRIAYVAMTRTQRDLIMCVSDPCFQRLTDRRPHFVASFECMTIEEYDASATEGTGACRSSQPH